MMKNETTKNDTAMNVPEWKAQGRHYRPKVDPKLCTKCHLCAVVCPHDAIDMKDDFPIINLTTCTGCLVCLRECPWNAIGEVAE